MTNEITGSEYHNELCELLATEELSLIDKYARLRFLFDRLCRQVTNTHNIHFSNQFSRLGWIAQHHLSQHKGLVTALNLFRIRVGKVIRNHHLPLETEFCQDLLALADAVSVLLNTPFDDTLQRLKANTKLHRSTSSHRTSAVKRMRARFSHRDETYLYVIPEESVDQKPVKVRMAVEKNGDHFFAESMELLHADAQINLLNLYPIEKEGCMVADLLVLEPDFLMDISTISACFEHYGHHPLNFFMKRLTIDTPTQHTILGNIANQFLDDLINETVEEPAQYLASMAKAFANAPIQIATCEALDDAKTQKEFFEETQKQFNHIKEIVEKMFPANGLDRSRALLEPSFICEALGVQGRLDLLQEDFTKFIELKSGKANQNFQTKQLSHKEDHYVQMMLYYAVLHFNLNLQPDQIQAFLLYSKHQLLYAMPPYWGLIKQAVDLRNQIVALEYRLQEHNSVAYSKQVLTSINAETLNLAGRTDKLWTNYQKPKIDQFAFELSQLTPIESDYYYTLFSFITKEEYVQKAGESPDAESSRGITTLWNASLKEKEESGEIIYDLLLRSSIILADKHLLKFEIPTMQDACLPNYRAGDSVLLYRRDHEQKGVTNQQVFKAQIDAIDAHTLLLSLRIIQKNDSVLPLSARYAIERDHMDVAFASMYKGLGQFIQATAQRRSLLLSQRVPRRAGVPIDATAYANDVERVVAKAMAAEDYFLLVGPPGTGKTSHALRRMVETFYADPQCNILLLAYTNKAVDEVCKSICAIDDQFPFIRIGQEASCEESFKQHLLKNRVVDCKRRTEVRDRLNSYRVFVGTVASVVRQTELFKLKTFDVAIVDEATQILEAQLLGLLTATDLAGRDAIKKFILIGDYKQLPAVVVQSDESAKVYAESLRAIGINSLKESLFERLYRWETKQGRFDFCDILTRQGRMHPEISEFPNRYFYHGKLDVVPLPHQTETNGGIVVDTNSLDQMVRYARIAFFPVVKRSRVTSNKISPEEAERVADLLQSWYKQKVEANEQVCLATEVGIITPYRSQIAMIRKELQYREIPDADRILIDTVERFQGGQRDLIIYSCSVNNPYQMLFLSNTIEEEEKRIDRKLNVALTRARKQLFIVGNSSILRRDPIYRQMLDFITDKNGYFQGD